MQFLQKQVIIYHLELVKINKIKFHFILSSESVLFDLCPKNVEKYESPEGLKMFVHLILKMSKILQPSVLYIKKCECNFYKKVRCSNYNH